MRQPERVARRQGRLDLSCAPVAAGCAGATAAAGVTLPIAIVAVSCDDRMRHYPPLSPINWVWKPWRVWAPAIVQEMVASASVSDSGLMSTSSIARLP